MWPTMSSESVMWPTVISSQSPINQGEVDSGQTASIPQSEQNEPPPPTGPPTSPWITSGNHLVTGDGCPVSPSGVYMSAMSDKLRRRSAC